MNGPKLTYPQLDLPVAQEVVAFREIIKVLKSDTVFGPVVNTWVVWDGSVNDTTEPQYSFCPFCQVSPFPTESSWITEGQHSMPIVLRVLLGVAGTNFDAIGNFWAAMRAAIFPQNNPTRRAFVESRLVGVARITRPTIQVSAYGQQTEEKGAKFMIADGTIRFGLLIGT